MDIDGRLTTLEAAGVSLASQYNTIADIRAITGYAGGDRAFCLENRRIYEFDATSTLVDNGTTVLRPDDTDSGQTGRWLEDVLLAPANHTHADLQPVPSSYTQGNLAVFDADGKLVDALKKIADFVQDPDYVHTDNNYTDAAKGKMANVPANTNSELAAKISKLTGLTSGDVGKMIIIKADGSIELYSQTPQELINSLFGKSDWTGTELDWSDMTIRNKTLTADETWTFSNLMAGKAITVYMTGNYNFTLPTYCTKIAGIYDGSLNNLIIFHCINDASGSELVYYQIFN